MRLALLADDLTGALDSAAEFCGDGPVPLPLAARREAGGLALDSASRDLPEAEAIARVAALAPRLRGADIAFLKIDSLLRGHVAATLAAVMAEGGFRHAILAPAFPAMGRITRGGAQWLREGDGWREIAALPRLPDTTIHDAETDADLARIVAAGRALPGPILWCGTGGLARALATRPVTPVPSLRAPLLGLFGSDHPVTARQLAACGDAALRLRLPDAARVTQTQSRHGAALVAPVLPAGMPRAEAAGRIAAFFAALTHALPQPATLLAAGGETLRGLCEALGAEALEVLGPVAPGVPRSRLLGGRWHGTDIVSKSGAFGGDALWRDLLIANGLLKEATPA